MNDTRTTTALTWISEPSTTSWPIVSVSERPSVADLILADDGALPFEVGTTYEVSMPIPPWIVVERWYGKPADRVRPSRRAKRRAKKRRQK
jgi:hypothetical protein